MILSDHTGDRYRNLPLDIVTAAACYRPVSAPSGTTRPDPRIGREFRLVLKTVTICVAVGGADPIVEGVAATLEAPPSRDFAIVQVPAPAREPHEHHRPRPARPVQCRVDVPSTTSAVASHNSITFFTSTGP